MTMTVDSRYEKLMKAAGRVEKAAGVVDKTSSSGLVQWQNQRLWELRELLWKAAAAMRDVASTAEEDPDQRGLRYVYFFNRTFVLTCDVAGMDEHGKLVRMPAGTAVTVADGGFLDDQGDQKDDHYRFSVVWCKDGSVSYDGASPDMLMPVGIPEDRIRICPECGRAMHEDDDNFGGREICEGCMVTGADLGTRFRCPKCNKRWDEEHLVNEVNNGHIVTGGDCPDCHTPAVPIPKEEQRA
jgi:ssDNA-binding Zn-finger/Zn-ribbon topoisomerase 1